MPPPVCRRCFSAKVITKRRSRTRLRPRASIRTRREMQGCEARGFPSLRMPLLEEAATRMRRSCRKQTASRGAPCPADRAERTAAAVASGCGLFAPSPRNRTGIELCESGGDKLCSHQDGACARRQVFGVGSANLLPICSRDRRTKVRGYRLHYIHLSCASGVQETESLRAKVYPSQYPDNEVLAYDL